jgi:hypothetical protein
MRRKAAIFSPVSECYRNRRKRFGLPVNLITAICELERDE